MNPARILYEDLPEHHRDLQDYVIIATALEEDVKVASFDRVLPGLWGV